MIDPAAFARTLLAAFVLLGLPVSCWAIRRGAWIATREGRL